MHYYQQNIGDYARDTGHLTVLEHGIYRLLLDWCYLNEKPITTEQAMRVGRGNPVETQSVLSEFFSETSDGWAHKRVQREVADYHVKSEKNRKNGMKGGRPKPTNNPMGSQTDAKHNPNQEPITNNHKPKKEIAPKVACPQDVDKQTWDDWQTLRKAKKAPVTQTVIDKARVEAEKANMTFEGFLKVWCARGSQGLEASWLKPDERIDKQTNGWAGAI
jgi:uncharacterized protein YdaU (DUF1376 family)